MENDSAQTTAPAGSRIVVGVDGSTSSDEALRWAAKQARLTGQAVHAVMSWEFPVDFGAPIAVGGDVDWAENSRGVLRKSVGNALAEADARKVVQHVVQGPAARALLEAAAGADLLVVGSRGHGGFSGLLLGSVSLHVVTHASCPVLVVHGPADRSR